MRIILKIALGFAAILVIIVLIGSFLGRKEPDSGPPNPAAEWARNERERIEKLPPKPANCPEPSMAEIKARRFVKQKLKAPSTAEFSDEEVRCAGGTKYAVSGYVEAKNAFGVPLRSRYVSIVESIGSDWYDRGTVIAE